MKPPTKPSPKPSSSRPRVPSRIRSLFALFLAYFGDKWERQYAGADLDQTAAIWAAELERFDDAVLRLAIEELKASGATFPPTLPEFFRLCADLRPRPTAALTLAAPRRTAPEGIFDRLRDQLERTRKPDDKE